MIIELTQAATARDADALAAVLAPGRGAVHRVCHGDRLLLVLTGPAAEGAGPAAGHPLVRRVVPTAGPYHLADRALHPAGSAVAVGGVTIGGPEFTVIAGPCAVETEEQLAASAGAVGAAGAALLRGGAYKPRTSPYAFQGLGEEALRLLARQRERGGLGVVTEATQPAEVERVAAYADMVQIGTRNMQNFALLREAGRCGRPVLLKRGMSATVEEWLCAAEYVLSEGDPDVVLCERGVRTFGRETRFTLDLGIVPTVKRLSHLPVVVDPSHSTGDPFLVAPMTVAAAAAGADGVLIDVHADPAAARCDGAQALLPEDFARLMDELPPVLAARGRGLSRPAGRVLGPVAA